MLIIDLKRIARKKGRTDVTEVLRKAGYNAHKAWRMANGKMKKWDLKDIEKLCEIFRCTPDDLFVLVPDKGKTYDEGQDLRKLLRTNEAFDLVGFMSAQPAEKIAGIEQLILEGIKNKTL